MFCSDRVFEISVSWLRGMSSFLESLVRLCHVPFLMELRKSSSFVNAACRDLDL